MQVHKFIGKKPDKNTQVFILPCSNNSTYFPIKSSVALTLYIKHWNKEELKRWFKVHGGGK